MFGVRHADTNAVDRLEGKMKPAMRVSIIFLLAVAALHALRILYGVEIRVDDLLIPMWPSVVAMLGLPALAAWLWSEQRERSS